MTAEHSQPPPQARLLRYLPLPTLAIGSSLLLALQLAAGTTPAFACLVFVFIWFTGLSFNELGGFQTVSGIAVSALALKTVIFAQFVKVALWQPADSNLIAPIETAEVMVVGMAGILVAAYFARPFVFHRDIFRPVLEPRVLLALCIVATAIGVVTQVAVRATGENSSLGRVLNGIVLYLPAFMPMGTIAGTAYVLTRSRGAKSFGLPVAIPLFLQLAFGALMASKLVMYEPFLAYFLTCLAFGYRYRLRHVPIALAIAAFCVVVLYPLSQIGRNIFKAQSLTENIDGFVEFVSTNMNSLQEIEELTATVAELEAADTSQGLYFGTPLGLVDRFSLISPADRLVAETLHSGHAGLDIMTKSIEILPRSITGAPEAFSIGNFLGKQTGLVGDTDDTTAIAFGPFAYAFHSFDLFGTFSTIFAIFFLFFVIQKFVGNSIAASIWAIILAVYVQHFFSEAPVTGLLFYIVRTMPFIWLLSLVIMPLCFALSRYLPNRKFSSYLFARNSQNIS